MGHPDNKWKWLRIKSDVDWRILLTEFSIETCDMRHDKVKEFFDIYWVWFIFASFILDNKIRIKRTIDCMLAFLSNESVLKEPTTKKEFSSEVIDLKI